MTNKDLFHNAVEGRMEELKQKPIVEEKETRGEKINKIFFFYVRLCYYNQFNFYFNRYVEVVYANILYDFTHHFKCVTYYYCNTAAQANSDFFE